MMNIRLTMGLPGLSPMTPWETVPMWAVSLIMFLLNIRVKSRAKNTILLFLSANGHPWIPEKSFIYEGLSLRNRIRIVVSKSPQTGYGRRAGVIVAEMATNSRSVGIFALYVSAM